MCPSPSPCPRAMGRQRLPLSKALPTLPDSRPRQALHTARRSPRERWQWGAGQREGVGPAPSPVSVQPHLLQGALPASSQPQARGLQGPEHILPGSWPRVGSESLGNEGGTSHEAGPADARAALGRNGLWCF